MSKTKICIDYPLATKSHGIVWNLIGHAHGLSKWMADYVEEDKGTYTFKWGEVWTQQDVRTSEVIGMEENHFIRLKWDVNADDKDYWEMRIEKSEFTGKLSLIITDHVDDDDVEYMKGVWNANLERLHAVSGL